MKELASEAVNGFYGSFVLAWALVASIVYGAYRLIWRLLNEFVEGQALHVAPGRTIKLPD